MSLFDASLLCANGSALLKSRSLNQQVFIEVLFKMRTLDRVQTEAEIYVRKTDGMDALFSPDMDCFI